LKVSHEKHFYLPTPQIVSQRRARGVSVHSIHRQAAGTEMRKTAIRKPMTRDFRARPMALSNVDSAFLPDRMFMTQGTSRRIIK
jgi:hypothetical protein